MVKMKNYINVSSTNRNYQMLEKRIWRGCNMCRLTVGWC